MIESLMYAIGNCAVIEQRGENFVNGLLDVVQAGYIEEGLLLAGE